MVLLLDYVMTCLNGFVGGITCLKQRKTGKTPTKTRPRTPLLTKIFDTVTKD